MFYKISFMLLFVLSCAWAEPFKVGYFDIPPHTNLTQKGEAAAGKNIDFFEALKADMGIKEVDYQMYPLSRLLLMLEYDRIDMILLLGKNSKREELFTYPKIPFYTLKPSLAFLRSNPLNEITSVEQLLSLRIGGYKKGYHSPMIRDKRLNLIPLSGNNIESRNLTLLNGKRLDAVYCPDYYILKDALEKLGLKDRIKILKLPEKDIHAYSVFSKKSGLKYKALYEKALLKQNQIKPYEEFLK